MKIINVVTRNNRGFLKNIFDYPFPDYRFFYNKDTLYEKKYNKKKRFLKKIVKLKIFDYIGLFQIIVAKSGEEDINFSFNRFVKGKKPYIIYLENPGSLINYMWKRGEHRATKINVNRCLKDNNLKAIVCMSDACKDGLSKYYQIPEHVKVKRIYPMIAEDFNYKENDIIAKSRNRVIECTFISEYFRLKGGKDIIEVIKRINKLKLPFHFTIVTSKNELDETDINALKECDNVDLHDFNLSKEQVFDLYKKSVILLNPTKMDSFSLVTLEAIKYGCLIIGNGLYAIKEMVPDTSLKYLTSPKYKYWNDDNTINFQIMCNEQQTVGNGEIDTAEVEFIVGHLIELNQNRDLLCHECLESYKLSRNKDFNSKEIAKQWGEIFEMALR